MIEIIKPRLNMPKENVMVYWLNNHFRIYRCRICHNFIKKKVKDHNHPPKRISEASRTLYGLIPTTSDAIEEIKKIRKERLRKVQP